MRWDPTQYLKFERPRLQPGLDLLHRLTRLTPRRVVDLGCGTGELTALLARQFSQAQVTGLDRSEQMLRRAREAHPELTFAQADAATWMPQVRPDVLFSNAALHWVADHQTLLPRLLDCVFEGGALAVQLPRNFEAPSHTLIREVATQLGLLERLALPDEPVLSAQRYHELLSPHASALDIWETTYLHELEGEDPVFEWVKGTALLPVQERLDEETFERFAERYRQALRQAYPPGEDGRTLFRFRRLFILARR
jgi:trans-aconitate 2-methyltransferase